MIALPQSARSLWRDSYPRSIYPQLTRDLTVDVVIVGAGITGLTSAYLLKQAGLSVAVLDKATVGAGTTGRTTGKVTSQHSLIYTDLKKRLGTEAARRYGQANQAAVAEIAAIIKREGINCDWKREDNYVFTTDQAQVKAFKTEAVTAAKLGLPATFETKAPLPFAITAAVRFRDQGKINTQKYLLGLARVIDGDGSHVFEHSAAIGIRDGSKVRVRTKHAKVVAKYVIVATNVPTSPLMARGGYCLLEYPIESYIVAGKLDRDIPGMYISPDDKHYSILPVTVGDERRLLVGGEGHLSGLRGNRQARYQRLASYAQKHFGVTEITHRWSDRDYLAYDSVPLIGKLYPWSKHAYVASAFNKWGLSSGTAAAIILRDEITQQPNEWAEVFDSTRSKPIRSIPRAVSKYISEYL